MLSRRGMWESRWTDMNQDWERGFYLLSSEPCRYGVQARFLDYWPDMVRLSVSLLDMPLTEIASHPRNTAITFLVLFSVPFVCGVLGTVFRSTREGYKRGVTCLVFILILPSPHHRWILVKVSHRLQRSLRS